MSIPKPTTVDFETFGIESRPAYPPIPIGVSIKKWGKPPKYLAWGHASGNTCTYLEAKAELEKVWKAKEGLLFQNAKFDLDVAETHFGLELPDWRKFHDTMFLIFLHDPHSSELGLKPVAQRFLGIEPEEMDVVVEWLVKNQPVPGVKIGRGKQSPTYAMKYLAYAPGNIVGNYANGDVDRTEKLFEYLWPLINEAEMVPAYDRERQLLPVLLRSERHGIRVDVDRLRDDIKTYDGWIEKIDLWIREKLGNPTQPVENFSEERKPINLDSNAQLAYALVRKKMADPQKLGITKAGNLQTNKEALKAGVTDRQMAAVLQYRSQLKTCLNTFMKTWLAMAERSDGLIYTTWNQVRGDFGTKTGRLSSTPNFQNIPKEFDQIFKDKDHPKLPVCPFKNLPPLPLCRGYIIPYDKDHILIGRDYSQQEPRILAHFEGGELMDQYVADPWIDFHDNAKDHLERITGRKYERKPVKNINLGIIYGQGVPSLAEKNNSSVEETRELRDAIYGLYPGLRDMYRDMRDRSKTNTPIRTWGSRVYYCEPPAIVNGRMMTFDYKMVNLLIQGSAADCSKEAAIRFALLKATDWKLLLQVHDEFLISVPKIHMVRGMDCLRKCMESVEFDVKILTEGSVSLESWARMIDYDKKGKMVYEERK